MCTSSVSDVIYHKFSPGAAFYTLNGEKVNVKLEFVLNVTELIKPRLLFLFLFQHFSLDKDWVTQSLFSDRRRLLKIENENNKMKTLTAETPYKGVPRDQFVNIEIYPGWLELPLNGGNFYGPNPVQATKVLL